MELSFIQTRSNAAKKVADGLDDSRTYICNNREFVPNFGERRRQGETISTAFVESTINQWSADDSSRNSRCSGRCAGPTFCCRPGRGSSTRISTTFSAVGINSGRNHKRRSKSTKWLDPRLFGALQRGQRAFLDDLFRSWYPNSGRSHKRRSKTSWRLDP
jgi:hypothetical protein